ncbi:uncharacterized protein LOC132562686 [Ylistrum balloti]|uniref:uncharacterized protein LOC132562686 n=1 Tax=Ylistrum balloti TaxID=509963 RepID=UPI002905A073|nr:uncharacterized protein LOC132562686 [Ylistrum balloti]
MSSPHETRANGGRPGMELVFRDVNAHIGPKQVLKEVSGMVKAGQLLAIMGPSGAGKTTLLNTLAGRNPLSSGEITLNGSKINKSLKRKVCYVLQQDVFFPSLTLKETLTFAAMVRLPDSMPKKEKLEKVNEIVDALDLNKCLETIMGDMWTRGLSGGEKKRANIACELITDPLMIFLDEPTSGLDYSTAFSLVQTLKMYARQHNKTVVATIHQPSSFIFYQFDSLLLMSEGESAYYGDISKVVEFFSSVGMEMSQHYNPADFVLEKLKEDEKTRKRIVTAAYDQRRKSDWPRVLRRDQNDVNVNQIHNSDPQHDLKQSKNFYDKIGILKKFRSKPKEAANDEEDPGSIHVSLMELDDIDNGVMESKIDNKQKWPTGFLTQYTNLTIRTFRQSKTQIFNKFKVIEAVTMTILVCLIWFQLPRTEATLRDRMGVIFFMSMNYGFTPLFDTVTSFPSERLVINKERASGWYRVSAYYLAKMTSELPLILAQPLVFGTIVYWSVGLNGVSAYFATIGTLFIHSIAGQSIGLFLGIACMDIRRAMTIATVCIMTTMLLGGFYTRHLPFWLSWLKYISFLYYTFHCLMSLEFTDALPVLCASSTNISESQFSSCLHHNVTTIPSQEVLQFFGIDWPFWKYLLPLFIFIIAFRIAGYFVLRFVQRPH